MVTNPSPLALPLTLLVPAYLLDIACYSAQLIDFSRVRGPSLREGPGAVPNVCDVFRAFPFVNGDDFE